MVRVLRIVVAAALVALNVTSEASCAVPVLGAEKEKHVKWEYGVLTTGPGANFYWNEPEVEITAKSWKELAENMKVHIAAEKPSDRLVRSAVLNHLGRKGWELVSHNSESRADRVTDSYVFKRRILADR